VAVFSATLARGAGVDPRQNVVHPRDADHQVLAAAQGRRAVVGGGHRDQVDVVPVQIGRCFEVGRDREPDLSRAAVDGEVCASSPERL